MVGGASRLINPWWCGAKIELFSRLDATKPETRRPETDLVSDLCLSVRSMATRRREEANALAAEEKQSEVRSASAREPHVAPLLC